MVEIELTDEEYKWFRAFLQSQRFNPELRELRKKHGMGD